MLQLIAQSNTSVNFLDQARQQGIPLGNSTFGAFVTSLLEGIMLIAFLLLLLYLLWAGIEWITAGGDSGKVGKARDKIVQAVIGMLVLASSIAIVIMMQRFLGVDGILFGGTGSGGSSIGTGGNGGSGGNSSGCNASTVGRPANDGGAGGYCNGGSARVVCQPPNDNLQHPGTSYGYYHYDPVECITGTPNCSYSFVNPSVCP